MLSRNAANPSLAAQINANLKDAQRELGSAVAEQARLNSALKGQEKHNSWTKF